MPAKLHATVNADPEELELERAIPGAPWTLVGEPAPDLAQTGPGMYSVVHKGRSYKVLVLKRDKETGTVRLRIGSYCHTVRLADERTRLMRLLGIDRGARAMASELKAPMPGLVLKVLVQEGDTVKKDDPLLVLEAMKMENMIKSTGDGVVRKAHVRPGAAVEKGQVLLSFEK